jgi:hypothetical protein
MQDLAQNALMTLIMIIVAVSAFGKIILSTDDEGEIKKTASQGFAAMVERWTKPKS